MPPWLFLPIWDGVKDPLGRDGVHTPLGELPGRPWKSVGETTTKHDTCLAQDAMLPGECGDDSLGLRLGWKLRQAQATHETIESQR